MNIIHTYKFQNLSKTCQNIKFKSQKSISNVINENCFILDLEISLLFLIILKFESDGKIILNLHFETKTLVLEK